MSRIEKLPRQEAYRSIAVLATVGALALSACSVEATPQNCGPAVNVSAKSDRPVPMTGDSQVSVVTLPNGKDVFIAASTVEAEATVATLDNTGPTEVHTSSGTKFIVNIVTRDGTPVPGAYRVTPCSPN